MSGARWRRAAIALLLGSGATLLAGCGGGQAEATAIAATAASGAARSHPVAERRALALPAPQPQAPEASALFDWAERSYPQFFPGPQANQSLPPYVLRHYPATGNYVGVDGQTVYILGPVSGGVLTAVGTLGDFACLVHPDSCAPARIAQLHHAGMAVFVRLQDGRLYAKGDGQTCRIGDGTRGQHTTPVALGSGWAQITGESTLHAVKADGSAWGWGAAGMVGDGSTLERCEPRRIGEGFAQVANNSHLPSGLGERSAAGVKRDGSLWLWGDNLLQNSTEHEPNRFNAPTRVGSDSDWAEVAVGADHLLLRKRDGSLWSLGGNGYGQLGNGEVRIVVRETTPQRLADQVVSIAAAAFRSYAVTAAGDLYAWGWNVDGLLGDDSNTDRSLPVHVGGGFVSVRAVHERVVALKADGSVWAWGLNQAFAGEVGDGALVQRTRPVPVASGVAQIANGDDGVLLLGSDGSLRGWGVHDFSRDARSGNFLFHSARVPTAFGFFP